MVKTTIILEDELYKRLVKEALEKYGTTRKLSFLINEKLRKLEGGTVSEPRKRMTFKVGKRLSPKDIERLIEEGLEEED
jgi:hypothetical protein